MINECESIKQEKSHSRRSEHQEIISKKDSSELALIKNQGKSKQTDRTNTKNGANAHHMAKTCCRKQSL